MLSWWRRRKERQQQVSQDADNLIVLFSERAYSAALARARHEDENEGDPSHCFAARREIARRVGKEVGLDTATRHLGR
jgi:hypothetical protein